MYGTVTGTILGIAYFFIFQLLGIFASLRIFRSEKRAASIFLGSVIGSFALHWLPVLYAFFLSFSVTAHVAALITMALLTALTAKFIPAVQRPPVFEKGKGGVIRTIRRGLSENPVLFVLVPLYILTIVILVHHTLSYSDGAMHCGQSTFGDMNMHLGFITSIANQETFPPEYSILPGTKLAYPFLSETISSSIYCFDTSLRTAYLLPMFFALLHVFFGIYLLVKNLLAQIGSAFRLKSVLAFLLFFLNGGFGMVYFLSEGLNNENFTRIFTEFYQTPTNYVTENIQWHNIICDMLIPQRATLFGWAILFPVLYLLQRGRQSKNRLYFISGGILAGGLVLIHTHSFLALGILCAVFLLQDLRGEEQTSLQSRIKVPAAALRTAAVIAFLAAMSVIRSIQCRDNPLSANAILALGFAVIAVYAIWLIRELSRHFSKEILFTWGLFLGIVLLLALPQLFGFTFRQAQGEQFVRGSFNWANSLESGDGYILFYLKNLGIMFLLTVLLFLFGSKKQRRLACPAAFLWVVCEFILFQPNPYDNNKLLLVAYLFFCIAAADFVTESIPSLFISALRRPARIAAVSVVAILGCLSAVLTIGREYVSDYELYSRPYLSLAEWVEENTEPDDILLTNVNHNNAIASLTGRNIVCGSSSFLYYHGVDYMQAENDVKRMYEDPSAREQLMKQYRVDYVVLGSYEMGNYSIPDLQEWIGRSEVVYCEDGIVVLAV